MKRVTVERIKGHPSFDAIVIGAGVSGAMIAEALTEKGLDVAIIDRRGAVLGSTPASTALVQYEIDVPLSKLSKQIGKERSTRVWRRSKLTLDSLRERTRALGVSADCVNRDSLLLDGDELDPDALFHEYEARREAGFENAFLDAKAVRARFGIKGRAAILTYDNMATNPRRLTAGYLHAALTRGAKIFAPYEVIGVDCGVHRVTLEMASGETLKASSLVFATGYEWVKGIPHPGQSIASTWALATRPQPRRLWPEHCFIWEASDPYLYMRVSPDFRIICGGEDEDFSDEPMRDALMDEKIQKISMKLKKIFPQLDTTPAFQWCANFGKSETGTPTIGAIPGMKNCYAAMGYGGNGITFSAMASQILSTTLAGGIDPDADLFSFNRSF
ncbi:FAD-dependent oxidoreductase [Methylocystis sp. 9N]|uniref:FAD-dependent oxidoreductase n=1 Tax=Methylocystis borbori TaxID=3118750 RepID=A0ABU7XGB7_9HYPH